MSPSMPSDWIRVVVPAAIVMSVAPPGYATRYLTVDEAQHLAFPTATQFVEAHVIFRPSDVAAIERLSGQKVRSRGQQVWRAQADGRLLGFFIVDYVIGKHLVIDYSVALEPDGHIKAVEVLEYREPHGGEITSHSWLEQFVGKTSRDPVTLDRDIRNISGATLSSQHVTEGVKRILAFYETCLH